MSRGSRRKREGKGSQASALPPAAATRKSSALALVLVLAACGLAGAAWVWRARQGGVPEAGGGRGLSLLLVTLDTTRADRLGCYGHAAAHTPRLDRLAAEGVRFRTATADAPITLPSHASILTGLHPFEHGVRNNGNFYLDESRPTLATVLRAQGYRTGAFVSAFVLDRRYGLGRGFETYDDRMQGAQQQVLQLEAERRGDRTALQLVQWLEQRAADGPGTPFFAWLHLYDPHEPYRPPPPFRERFAADPYDGELAFADAALASVLDALERLGRLNNTVVAVTADHGESLGDHGEETHSMFVYESAIRVPLILWRPGLLPSGRVVLDPVRTVDLSPTLLELLQAPALPAPGARSLLGLALGRSTGPAPAAYAETYLPKFYMNWAPLRALRDARFKLIDAPRPELYDLQRDPGETNNLYAVERAKADALRAELERLTAGSEGAMSVGALDREAQEKLAALGYLGAGASTPATPASASADPKDVIAIFNRLRRANSAVRDRHFDVALPILREVLEKDPQNAFARLVLGSAHMGLRDFPAALEQYRAYLELVPTSSYAHQWSAICHLNLGDRQAALREADAALAIDPRFSDARVLRAGVLASQGRHAQAILELRSAVATDPSKTMLRLDLAKVLAEAGRAAEARAEYVAALRQEPDFAPALVGLAALQAAAGQLDQAAGGLWRALELDPSQLEARFNLAQVLERQGQAQEARAQYARVAAAEGASPALRAAARQRLGQGRR